MLYPNDDANQFVDSKHIVEDHAKVGLGLAQTGFSK